MSETERERERRRRREEATRIEDIPVISPLGPWWTPVSTPEYEPPPSHDNSIDYGGGGGDFGGGGSDGSFGD